MPALLCLMFIVLAGTAGEITITHSMKRVGEVHSFTPRSILTFLGRAFRQRSMWIGLLLMTLGFFSLLALLSWENVSLVVPATALSYAVGAVGAKFFLGERVDRLRWVGVLLVVLGVVLVWFG